MQDDLLEILENLKGQRVVDVVTGDIEGEESFSQMAVLRLENDQQLSIQSHSLRREKNDLHPEDTGYSGLAGSYGDLDEFWEDVDAKGDK